MRLFLKMNYKKFNIVGFDAVSNDGKSDKEVLAKNALGLLFPNGKFRKKYS